MSQYRAAQYQLLSAFLESIAYGCYLVVFLKCIRVLHAKHSQGRQLPIYLLVTSLSIFLLATTHVVLTLLRNYEANTTHMERPYAAEAYFADAGSHLAVSVDTIYVTTTLVADLFIVYRTWVLYGHDWRIVVLPLLLFCLGIGLSVWSIWTVAQLRLPFNPKEFYNAISRAKSFFVSTLVLNLICTALISYRIWLVSRASAHAVGNKGMSGTVMSVVIDSAAIYTTFMIVLIIVDSYLSPATYLLLNPMSSIIGIVFSSIIIRLWQLSDKEVSNPYTNRASGLVFASRPPRQSQYSSVEIVLAPRKPEEFNESSGRTEEEPMAPSSVM